MLSSLSLTFKNRSWVCDRDEYALIRAAQSGDLEAFNELVLIYQDVLYRTARRFLGSDLFAEDVTQDAFVSAFCNVRSFRGDSLKSWLMRILVNKCYDHLRKLQRNPTISIGTLVYHTEDDVDESIWMRDDGVPLETFVERSDLNRDVYAALDRLPFRQRMLVTLVDVEGLDYREAARALAIPIGTVKSRLARARSKLREALRGCDGFQS